MFEKLLMKVGYYKPGKEYWVDFSLVHITDEFAAHKIGEKKMERKLKYYRHTGKFESKVVLNKDFVLIDGYSTYCLIKEMRLDKLAVWFED